MKNFFLTICGASLLALAAPLASANTIYSFNGSGPSGNPAVNFVYNSPSTINMTTTVNPPICTVNGISDCTSVVFSITGMGSDEDIFVHYAISSVIEFEFAPGTFETQGVHFTNAGPNPGLLIVNINPVPEPSSLALLGTGLFGAAGLFRRRFFSGKA